MSPKKGMSASPGEVEWQCPYCDFAADVLSDVRDHITESVGGEHEGVSGESPDRDIVGVDPDSGEEIDVVEATDVVRPEESDCGVEGVPNKDVILTAFHITGADVVYKEVFEALEDAELIDCGYEYFRREFSSAVKADTSSEEVDAAVEQYIVDAVEPVLMHASLLDENGDGVEQSVSSEETGEGGAVDVEKLKDLREKLELFRDEAETEIAAEDTRELHRIMFITNFAVAGINEALDGVE